MQTIMERMQGGGHFTAAALQRTHADVKEIEKELQATLDAIEEENKDESNTAE